MDEDEVFRAVRDSAQVRMRLKQYEGLRPLLDASTFAKALSDMDSDKDGIITIHEFRAAALHTAAYEIKRDTHKDVLSVAYEALDRSGKGTIQSVVLCVWCCVLLCAVFCCCWYCMLIQL